MLPDRPLAGVRILDDVRGPLAPVTRYLAELGAEVVRTAPPGPDAVAELEANRGKIAAGAGGLAEAARVHAIVADAGSPLDLAALRRDRPALVTMTVSDFGVAAGMAGWIATEPVLHALSGELSRSGLRGREPLLPPAGLAYRCACSQGAFVLISSIHRALRMGAGDHIDFAALEGAAQALDPGYGINGSATMGRPAHLLSRDRPAGGVQYPILRCADGHIRLCLLARRQWRGMFRWMGEPPAFAAPELDGMIARYRSAALRDALAGFFLPLTKDEIERGGAAHGVPVAALRTLADCLTEPHFRERGVFSTYPSTGAGAVTLPDGVVAIDGERMTVPAAPAAGGPAFPPPATAPADGPFAGLRVLDLGVIVVGGEQGRLLADGGADVVKVESRAYPDGNRQSYLDYGLSVSFAAGHRNKRSLGINLRDAAGRALFLRLVREADVLLSNFKPGTMDALGLGWDVVRRANPGLVAVESSAFGAGGPWSGRMGYGPLIRAATGLTGMWRYPDDPEGYCDAVTIYPDHVAARIGATAAVALLIRRLRTGGGGRAEIAQAEVMLDHVALDVARASRGEPPAGPPDWPWSVYPARGDDEWCVVTVRDDEDWRRLAQAIGLGGRDDLARTPDRLRSRAVIDAAIGCWLSGRDADDAMRELQARGIPAARMLRVADLPAFDHYTRRGFYRVERHPYLREDVIAERWAAMREGTPEAPARPAPLAGEHGLEIVADWLGEADGDALVRAGVIEPLDEAILASAVAAVSSAESPTSIMGHAA